MKQKGLMSLIIVVMCMWFVSPVMAEVEATAADQKPPMSAEEQQMMEKWEKYMTPGKEHKVLAMQAGSWEFVSTMWMQPGAEPEVSKGTTEGRMILGGRYLYSENKSMMMGKPFEGISICGYDNHLKKFFSIWIDDMGTGMYETWGMCKDEACKVMEFTGEWPDPISGTTMKVRQLSTTTDDDHYLFEMFMGMPDGKEFKSMELKYSRKK